MRQAACAAPQCAHLYVVASPSGRAAAVLTHAAAGFARAARCATLAQTRNPDTPLLSATKCGDCIPPRGLLRPLTARLDDVDGRHGAVRGRGTQGAGAEELQVVRRREGGQPFRAGARGRERGGHGVQVDGGGCEASATLVCSACSALLCSALVCRAREAEARSSLRHSVRAVEVGSGVRGRPMRCEAAPHAERGATPASSSARCAARRARRMWRASSHGLALPCAEIRPT